MTSPGTKSSYPRPPRSFNPSLVGAVSSDAAAEAAPSTGGTAAPVALAARAARAHASAAGSAGDSWIGNICNERGTSTHPFDPGTVFPMEVRYSSDERARHNGSWLQHGNSSSRNSSSGRRQKQKQQQQQQQRRHQRPQLMVGCNLCWSTATTL